ncbi:hypothetical protein CHUAL_003529 [Chamberlinius hualienensis]
MLIVCVTILLEIALVTGNDDGPIVQTDSGNIQGCEEKNIEGLLSFCNGKPPTTTIDSGTIEGLALTSRTGKPYNAYLGIPYAKPPVNDLRFKPPVPFGKWVGIRNGSIDSPMCPQVDLITKTYVGDENCLFLNVYVPQIYGKYQKNLNVMVYIHGGGYIVEAGNKAWYGPQNFMEYSVILVTINYRLSALGFMSTNDSSAYGNYGMLDQVEALKWVQKNIGYFGGDPQQVTIFGNSAGAASVFFHSISPISKGLFAKAICESGVGINFWGFISNPRDMAVKLAKKLNCTTNNSKKMVECISNKTAKEIIEAAHFFQKTGFLPVNWGPVVDGPGKFLPESPISLITSKNSSINKEPLVIGYTDIEGYTFYADLNRTFNTSGEIFFDTQLAEILPLFTPIQSFMKNIIDKIKRFYKNKDINQEKTFLEVLSRLIGDAMFNGAIDQAIELFSENGWPVYKFTYSYISKNCLASLFNFPCGIYSSHADNVFLEFFYLSPTQNMTENDTKMSNVINSLWVNFASNDKLLLDDYVEWPLYSKPSRKYVELNLKPVIKSGFMKNVTDLWAVEVPMLVAEYDKN